MSNVDHSERAHSQLGASSSKRWFACPASVPLSDGVEQKESKYAAEGTAAHELAEMALVQNKPANAFIGEDINGFEVTDEMAEAVQVYVDEVARRAGEFTDVSIEQRFSLDWIDPELFGTNDCAIYDDLGTLTIMDYKHGRGVAVEARDNPQLLYYALGAARGLELSEVRLVIVQPRCDHPDGPVREWVVTPDELKKFEITLKDRVAVVNTARLVKNKNIHNLYKDYAEAGDHCRFCPASGFCEKLKSKSLEVAQAEFSPIGELSLPEPESLPTHTVANILNYADMISGWIESVRHYAHNEAERGVEIEGYKLVKRRANRKWKDEKKAIEEFEMLFGDDLFTKKLKSPAQVEKIVGKEQVAPLVEKPDTGNTLVPETDKRPAIMPRAIEDFTDI